MIIYLFRPVLFDWLPRFQINFINCWPCINYMSVLTYAWNLCKRNKRISHRESLHINICLNINFTSTLIEWHSIKASEASECDLTIKVIMMYNVILNWCYIRAKQNIYLSCSAIFLLKYMWFIRVSLHFCKNSSNIECIPLVPQDTLKQVKEPRIKCLLNKNNIPCKCILISWKAAFCSSSLPNGTHRGLCCVFKELHFHCFLRRRFPI